MQVDNSHLKIKSTKFDGKKLIIPLINMKHLINAPFQMNKTPKQRQLYTLVVFFFYPEKKISGWIEDIGLLRKLHF